MAWHGMRCGSSHWMSLSHPREATAFKAIEWQYGQGVPVYWLPARSCVTAVIGHLGGVSKAVLGCNAFRAADSTTQRVAGFPVSTASKSPAGNTQSQDNMGSLS
jgi:hypothetical protein